MSFEGASHTKLFSTLLQLSQEQEQPRPPVTGPPLDQRR